MNRLADVDIGSLSIEMALAVFGPPIAALWFAWQKSRKELQQLHVLTRETLEQLHEELDSARLAHMEDMRSLHARIVKIKGLPAKAHSPVRTLTGTVVSSDDSVCRHGRG